MNKTMLLDVGAPQPKHPARYSEALLPVMAEMLRGSERVLDIFAGTGERLLSVCPDAYLNEIEPRWAAISQRKTKRSFVGDATALRWNDGYFDTICTSPSYGNRMSDTLIDKYKRMSYTAAMGEPLQPNNAGAMQWGGSYRYLHERAWREAKRVLKHDGIIIVNMKDHIRNFKRVRVTLWHIYCLRGLGFTVERMERVSVESFVYGANRKARIPYESVILFRLTAK